MKRFFLEIIILVLFASILIFYKFNQVPRNLSYDEVEFAKLALSLDKKPYTPYSSLATGHSTLYFYIILFSFKMFSLNNFALRLPSALFGVLNVLLFYLIVKKAMKQWFPFIMSLVFLTSRWYFNFARFSFEATFLLFLELTAVYLFFNFLQQRRTTDLFLTAFFAGLAFNSYTPGRIFFILPLLFVIKKLRKQFNPEAESQSPTSWLRGRQVRFRASNSPIRQLAMSLLIFFLTLLPLSSYFLTHPDIRFQQQFFPVNPNESIHRKIEFLWRNIKSTVLMFNIKGDVNGRHNYPFKPALNPILGLFFVGGIILALKNYKNFYNQFFLLYFAVSLIPSLLTYPWENPNMLRTFTAIPSVVFFVGRTLESLLFTGFKRPLKSSKKFLLPIFFALFLIFISSLYEIRTYFKYQTKVFDQAFEVREGLKNVIR